MSKVPVWLWIAIAFVAILVIGYYIYYQNQKKKLDSLQNPTVASNGSIGICDLINQISQNIQTT